MRGMETFTLVPRGPYSLAASIRFLEGFTPASYSNAPDGVLELAFPAEGSWRTVGVRVSQAGEKVDAEIVSPAQPGADLVAEVRPQVERILSLDVDGSGFPGVGELDPVVGEIQRRYPGLRPVGFWSPYEAAAWTIIGHRIRITQAATLKARIAERLGEPVSFGGRVMHAFPSPQQLAKLDAFPGLAGRKPEWLRSLAQAALDGQLDARPAARPAGRRRPGGPEEAARDRGLLRRADPAARSGRPRRRAQRRAAAGPCGRARLRAARAGHTRADPGDQRELAALPHLGHAVAADPAGGRDR